MAVFYFATEGGDWVECSAPLNVMDPVAVQSADDNCNMIVTGDGIGSSNAWLSPSSECTWGGLACNLNMNIERVQFQRNDVRGTLPSELIQLSQLRFLILEEGILTGTIPSLLGNIVTLEEIDLNYNLMQGPLPESLFSLSNLSQLDLNDNEFTGTISSNFALLTQLSFFQIDQNKFTGTVPENFGSLSLLEVATMENNMLQGTIPATVCQLVSSKLAVLTSDCLLAQGRPSPPYVECSCCTRCY
jgi:hypothetical protein